MAGTGDPTLNTGGSNRFSIRAAWVNGATVDNTGVQVFGDQAMGLYANAAAGQAAPNFYMARVLPAAAGQTLRIKLWDIGDCGGGCSQGNVVLTFTLPNNQTATCSVSIYYPASQNVGSSCSFPTWTSNYQADNNWLVIDLNLPSTYTCTTSDPFDCWVRMKYSTSNGALNDTTTWSAQLLGNPVRLIK